MSRPRKSQPARQDRLSEDARAGLEALIKLLQPRGCPGWRYRCLAECVLVNGQPYRPQVLPKRFPRGPAKRCFINSFVTAASHGLIYVEGYARGEGDALLLHAWCIEPGSDLVIDRTWEHGTAYYGIPLDFGFVSRTRKARGYYGVLDNWEEDYPVLRLPPEAWKYRGP